MELKNGVNLESTIIKGVNGFDVEVKPGDEIYLINPDNIKDFRERKKQSSNNGSIIREIGPFPYTLLKITKYPMATTFIITFEVKGEKGTKKNLVKSYFTDE